MDPDDANLEVPLVRLLRSYSVSDLTKANRQKMRDMFSLRLAGGTRRGYGEKRKDMSRGMSWKPGSI